MSTPSSGNKFLRVLGIVLLSLTVLMTLLGGIGTSCVAFAPTKWGPSMARLSPVQPIFQLLVVASIAAGIWGVIATIRLARRRPNAFRDVMIFLVVAGVASAIQYYFSLTLRGSTAPNNVRLYLTVLALIVFIIFRLPGIWERIGYEGTGGDAGSGRLAGGVALCLCGLITLAAPFWAGPSHMVGGYNTVEVLLWHLVIAGVTMLSAGVVMLAWPLMRRSANEVVTHTA